MTAIIETTTYEFPSDTVTADRPGPEADRAAEARAELAWLLAQAYAVTPLVSEPFPIDRLVLYRSHLQRPAPRYEPLGRFPLGP